MTSETINKLCCPFDKRDLDLTIIHKTIEGNIVEGYFTCNQCKRIYLIVKGIPIMCPDEYREYKLEEPLLKKWDHHLQNKTIENFRLVEPVSENNA